jgi:hypothetical protein
MSACDCNVIDVQMEYFIPKSAIFLFLKYLSVVGKLPKNKRTTKESVAANI